MPILRLVVTFIVLSHDRRQVVHFNATGHPTAQHDPAFLLQRYPRCISRASMKSRIRQSCLVLVCGPIVAFANPALSTTFNEDLKRVDEALKANPSGVLRQSLESCLKQRRSGPADSGPAERIQVSRCPEEGVIK